MNPRLDNLEWVTRAQNHAHAIKMGLWKPCRGESNGFSKLKEQDIETIRLLITHGIKQKYIAEFFGVTQENISYIAIGQAWTHI